MKTAIISDIKRFAVHDGDGIRTTVFLRGARFAVGGVTIPRGFPSVRNWPITRTNALAAVRVCRRVRMALTL